MKKIFFCLFIAILLILILPQIGCSSYQKHTLEEWEAIEKERLSAAEEDKQYRGKVLKLISEEKQEIEGGPISTLQIFEVNITNGPFKGETIEVSNLLEEDSVYNIEVNEGDRIFVILEVDQEANIVNAYATGTIKDNYLVIITVLFTVLLIIIGKFKGLRAFIALAITAVAVVKILLPLILKGYNPIVISVMIGLGVTIVTLLIISGINRKSLSTIIGTSSGILIGGTLALIFGNLSNLTGLSSEEARMLAYIPQDIDFDYRGILFSGIILASLGAVMDVSMSISSSMFEIAKADPTIRKNGLISAGMNVGRDIIGTMSNTLILVYIGSSVPLMLLLLAYEIPFIEIINKDLIASEIIRALSGSMGLILAIPITVFVSAGMFNRKYISRAKHRKI